MRSAICEKLKMLSLLELINSGPLYDSLSEAICELESLLESGCPLADYMDFCSSRGLSLERLSEALLDRAENLADAGLESIELIEGIPFDS